MRGILENEAINRSKKAKLLFSNYTIVACLDKKYAFVISYFKISSFFIRTIKGQDMSKDKIDKHRRTKHAIWRGIAREKADLLIVHFLLTVHIDIFLKLSRKLSLNTLHAS